MSENDPWRPLADFERQFCYDTGEWSRAELRRRLGEKIEQDRLDFKLRDEREWSWTEWSTIVEALELNDYKTALAARNAEERKIPRYNPRRRRDGDVPATDGSPPRVSPRKPQAPTWKRLFDDPSLRLHEAQVRKCLASHSGIRPQAEPRPLGDVSAPAKAGLGDGVGQAQRNGGRRAEHPWDGAISALLVTYRTKGSIPKTNGAIENDLSDVFRMLNSKCPSHSQLAGAANFIRLLFDGKEFDGKQREKLPRWALPIVAREVGPQSRRD